MSLFGKNDQSLASLLKRIQNDNYKGSAELDELFEQIAVQPDLTPERITWMVSHVTPRVREFAFKQLATMRDRMPIDLLVREMPGKNSTVRAEIARFVSQGTDASRLLPIVGPMIHSKDAETREAALDLVAAHPRWRDLLGVVKAGLRDAVPAIRLRAVRILANGAEDAVVFFTLRELINDEDDSVRASVIDGLARAPRPEIVEAFFERLPFEGPQERNVMIRALSQLARKDQARVQERLLPVLGDENAEMREAAARLLGEMPNKTQVLRAFLVHSRGIASWLRERSTASILKMSNDVVEPLVALMQDPDEDVRVSAMLMASKLKDARVLPHAKAMFLGTGDWWVRSIAAEMLGNVASPEVIATLVSRLEDPEMRYTVITALGKIQSPVVLPHLLPCLADPSRGIRLVTLDALAGFKGNEVANAVIKLAREDSEPAVRDKAITVLESMVGNLSGDAIKSMSQKPYAAAPAVGDSGLSMANEELNAPR